MLEQVCAGSLPQFGAVKYTAPRLEAKASDLADEEGRRATNREERDCMLLRAAFLEAPDVGEQHPLPVGGSAYQLINGELVGQLLARERPQRRQEIVKVMWDWAPECITARSEHASSLDTTQSAGRQQRE